MWDEEAFAGILSACYGIDGLLGYSDSGDEIRFRPPAPVLDPQAATFRSKSPIFNDLAISHRLSLLVGRGKYAIPEDSAFAIKSIESSARRIEPADGYEAELRFEILARRYGAITALKSTLVTGHGGEGRTTTTEFNVLPASLAGFVRRSRQFMDFAEVAMGRDEPSLSTVADNHFRYHASEADRLSDGLRVDHVPALTLIDIALLVGGAALSGSACPDISAEFLSYTDPRHAFDILLRTDPGAVEFVQNGQRVAIVSELIRPAEWSASTQ